MCDQNIQTKDVSEGITHHIHLLTCFTRSVFLGHQFFKMLFRKGTPNLTFWNSLCTVSSYQKFTNHNRILELLESITVKCTMYLYLNQSFLIVGVIDYQTQAILFSLFSFTEYYELVISWNTHWETLFEASWPWESVYHSLKATQPQGQSGAQGADIQKKVIKSGKSMRVGQNRITSLIKISQNAISLLIAYCLSAYLDTC